MRVRKLNPAGLRITPIANLGWNVIGRKIIDPMISCQTHSRISYKNKVEWKNFYFPDVPAVVEYTFHLRPLARLEVLGLKTELVAGKLIFHYSK